jgi:phosphatidylinositol alpha-1,6-mannosyltransferase
MKPKLALLTFDFAPQIGGVQTYLFELSKRLVNYYDLFVITPVAGSLPDDIFMQRLIIPSRGFRAFLSQLRLLQPDKILLGHAHPQLLLSALLFAKGRYATMTYGNDFLAAQQRWHRFLFNWMLAQSNPLITITKANRQRLQLLGLPQAKVIYPGTDISNFTPLPKLKTADPTLLTVGRLVSRKGIDTVLQALPSLQQQFPTLCYEIVGDGPDRERLQTLVAKLGLDSAVKFLGKVSDANLLAAYRRADIFVMPTREEKEIASMEGFGIVYLEASACGLPVVAGRSGGVAEAVRDGETGYLVEPDNPVALAETLSHLLIDEDLRRRLGQNGRRWVETEMNWDRAARQMQLALDTV